MQTLQVLQIEISNAEYLQDNKGGIAMKKRFSLGQLLVDAMEEYCDNIIRTTPV